MSDQARDDWRFTDAEYAELRGLLNKHAIALADLVAAAMDDGIAPMPDDEGIVGELASVPPEAERA